MATAQHHARPAIDLTTPDPLREMSIWDLARALQEQWVNEQPADWSMVSEVVHRAIQADQPSEGQVLKSAVADTTERSDDTASVANCAVCAGTLLECPKCGHTGCNNQGVGAYSSYPCPNRVDLGSSRTRRCGECGCEALEPA